MNNRSASIAASWKVQATAAKRTTRHSVIAGGKRFPSTKAAFIAFGLPLTNHIHFRMLLKASGTNKFITGPRRGITFKIAN